MFAVFDLGLVAILLLVVLGVIVLGGFLALIYFLFIGSRESQDDDPD